MLLKTQHNPILYAYYCHNAAHIKDSNLLVANEAQGSGGGELSQLLAEVSFCYFFLNAALNICFEF